MTQAEMIAVRLTADGDAQWFIDHPERSYRVRLATPVEIALERAARDMEPIPKGFKVVACIRQIEPHLRVTALCLGENRNDVENASEAKAKTLFELAARTMRPTVH